MRPGGPAAGFSLVGLVATIAIMLILMGAAVPAWRYVMKDDREEELIFRGSQIADAIGRYYRKNANAAPPSLEVLVQGKYLRKLYKDPMAKDGKWRLIRQGEAVGPITPPGTPSPFPGVASPSPSPSPRPGGPGVPVGATIGGIAGVASTSTEKSLRLFNGRQRYNEWIFTVGQPRIIGRSPSLVPIPGLGGPSPQPPVRR